MDLYFQIYSANYVYQSIIDDAVQSKILNAKTYQYNYVLILQKIPHHKDTRGNNICVLLPKLHTDAGHNFFLLQGVKVI